MLQAHELQSEARPKLLEPGLHFCLLVLLARLLLLLLLKDVAMMPASRITDFDKMRRLTGLFRPWSDNRTEHRMQSMIKPGEAHFFTSCIFL